MSTWIPKLTEHENVGLIEIILKSLVNTVFLKLILGTRKLFAHSNKYKQII